MIIVVPYIKGVADYRALAEEMNKRGPLATHLLRVVSSVEDQDEAYAFGQLVAGLFMKSSSLALTPAAPGRVNLANELFRSAVKFTANYQAGDGEIPNPPALYMDPTYRPVKSGWLDAVQTEFYLRGAPPVLGVSKPDEEGARIFQGPVVFSKNFAANSSLVNFLPPDTHYRHYMRWEFSRNHLETKLIGEDASSVLRPPAQVKGRAKQEQQSE